jgi:hypothetical protein
MKNTGPTDNMREKIKVHNPEKMREGKRKTAFHKK